MVKKTKGIIATISLITIVAMLGTFSCYADSDLKDAKVKKAFDIVKAKKELADKHKDKAKELTTEENSDRKHKVKEILEKRITKNESIDLIDKELESLGIYKLDVPESDDTANAMSSSADVYLAKPSIFYDSWSREWGVSTSGYWRNTNFDGIVGNVGGRDGYGITYYNTSGTYSTSVTSSYASIYDQNGENSDTTWNPSNGDGKYGVEFELQDYRKVGSADRYIGAKFDCCIWYTSSWSSFNGYARTLYAHTWSTTNISSVQFGVDGKQFGCDVTFSSTSNNFKCFNGADAAF